MVAPWQKAVVKKSVETQTGAPHKHTTAQVSGCSECQSLALEVQGDRDNTCIRRDQVNDLLSLVGQALPKGRGGEAEEHQGE